MKGTAGKSLIAVTIYVCGNIICGLLDFLLEKTIHVSPVFLLAFNFVALIYAIKTIQPASLKKTLIVSFIAHILIVLVLSLTIKNLPLNDIPEPMMVTIETGPDSMAYGINEAVSQPSSEQSPTLSERITASDNRSRTIPDTATPVRSGIREVADYSSDVRQQIRNVPTTTSESDLHASQANSERIHEVAQNLDRFLEEDAHQQAQNNELNQVNQNIENVLNQTTATTSGGHQGNPSGGDPLSDASWSSAPRKTLFFPDIESRIPAEYRQRGMGYSVRVRITFDRNGLATGVEMLESSGDPTIDNIFMVQLRKVRVEAINSDRTDVVTKTFKISLR